MRISTSYDHIPEKKVIEAPCWNCRMPVLITLPFVGCVYCSRCVSSSAGTEHLQWESKPTEARAK